MHRSHHQWHSLRLGRNMELLIFGHAGAPVIVFPTSQGRFYEFEDRGMVGALGEHLEQGWIQLVCVDSIDSESWYCKWAHPSGRVTRHMQYEQYLQHEVVPLIAQHNGNNFWMTTGCSFGAYHAVNFALRNPWLVRRTIGLSGLYDLRAFMDGYYDDNFYFNNPVDYTAHLHAADQLEALRRQDIIIVTGQDDSNRWSSERLSANLWQHGVGNALRIWDDWAHDWPWWRDQIRMYIGGHD